MNILQGIVYVKKLSKLDKITKKIQKTTTNNKHLHLKVLQMIQNGTIQQINGLFIPRDVLHISMNRKLVNDCQALTIIITKT